MSRNNSLSYISKEKSFKEYSLDLFNEESIHLNIEFGKGQSEDIIITKNSNPEELSYNFCHMNNLEFKCMQYLSSKIKLIQENNFYKSKIIHKSAIEKNIDKQKKAILNGEIKDVNKIKNEKYLKQFLNKDISLNNKEYEQYNSLVYHTENKYPSFHIYKKFITKKNNKDNINYYNNNSISNKNEIKNISISNNSIKNTNSTTNVISQTIQNCLEIIENEEKPLYNESNSEINKDSKSSKIIEKSYKENNSASFINIENNNISNNILFNNNLNYYNVENNNSANFNKDIDSIKELNKDYYENINIEDGNILFNKESFIENKNKINSNDLLNNEIQNIDKDISLSIYKPENNILNKNIINKTTFSFNNKENEKNIIKDSINKDLIISQAINLSIIGAMNKGVKKRTLLSPKIPYNNNFKDIIEQKYKKTLSKSNRCFQKFKNNIKINYANNRSISNKSKTFLGIFNDTTNLINNGIGNKYKQSPSIHSNFKNKNFINNKEVEYTPSTYIKSCKNSLSSLAVSDKNLIFPIKDNNLRNDILNKINNANKFDEFIHLPNSIQNKTELSIKNNKLLNKIKMSQYNSNSLCLKENTINEELENNMFLNGYYSNIKENKCFKYKNILENYNQKNHDINNYKSINYNNIYYTKTINIKKKNKKRINKRHLFMEKNNIFTTSNTLSNLSSIHYKHKSNDNINNNLNEKLKKNHIIHTNNNSVYITNNFFNKILFKYDNLLQIKKPINETKKYYELNFLTNNIISKNEIEKCFENIFNYITKNNKYLDAFSIMNTKSIPIQIYKPIQFVIKNCNNKKRFISASEFIRKGYELFNYFSQNDKIALINFKIIS